MKHTVYNIKVRVQPKSSQEKVVKVNDIEYKVYTHKPAIDGEANDAVRELLAEHLGIKKYNILIVKGDRSKNKLIEIRS
jgi:uncharacterized protein